MAAAQLRMGIAPADVVDAICVRFDGGTLRIEGPAELEARLPHTVWDPRTGCHRAPAHRYTEVIERLGTAGWAIEDSVATALVTPPVALSSPPLRGYQADALSAWRSHACRGLIVLPTGAGKTRVAIAAIAHARRRTLVLVPTRALLEQWERELRRWYQGPIGIVGDGERRVEALTVMTFASGYQRLDQLGGRFGLLVVDEVHHFASGGWAEALEMCPATHRLGLTATPERPGSSGAERLDELIGPVVYELGVNALVGTHLAPLDMVKHRVQLTRAERHAYEAGYGPFAARLATLRAANPSLDWAGVVRTLSRSADGNVILAGLARAVAIAGFSSGKRALVEKLLARHWRDRTLVFTALARDAVELSRALLVPVITAEIGRTERHEILDGFRDGKYRAIVSARVLNEGLDVPDASVAIVVGARSVAREYVQRIGRVLRPGPAKRAIVHELITDRTLDAARAERRRQLALGT